MVLFIFTLISFAFRSTTCFFPESEEKSSANRTSYRGAETSLTKPTNQLQQESRVRTCLKSQLILLLPTFPQWNSWCVFIYFRSQRLIESALAENECMKYLIRDQMRCLVDSVYPITLKQGVSVVQEEDNGTQAYIVEGEQECENERATLAS